MKEVFTGMPYLFNPDNIGYGVKRPFNIAIVTNAGDCISDCLVVNQYGKKCPGLEHPIPINNENLYELEYKQLFRLGVIINDGNFNFCRN